MPEVYEIKDPRDGSVFELQLDHPPTPEEARTAVAKYRVTSAKASGQPTMGPAPTGEGLSSWQRFVDQITRAMGPQLQKGDLPPNPIGPQTRALVNTPLARPTGIDVLDSFTSPLSLGLSAAGMAGKAIGAMRPVATAAVDTVRAAEIGPEIRSLLLGHRGEKVAKIAAKLRDALAESPAPESPASVPAPSAASAETAVPPAPTPGRARPARPAGSTPPAATSRTTTPVSPAMEEIDQRMSGGVDMPTKGNGAPAFDLHSMSPAEKSQALKWYEAGVKPEDIVQRITASRKFSGTMKTATPDEAAAESARMAQESAKRSRRGAPEE